MTDQESPRWLFKDCPKCGSNFTQKDNFGVFCCMANCYWTISGEDAEEFAKEADQEAAAR